MTNISALALLLFTVIGLTQPADAEVNREKILKDSGVYGTFAVFKVGDHWWQMDHDAKTNAIAEVKKVLQKHAEKVLVDTYLLRGISEKADFFIRVHSEGIISNQNFLFELMGTTFGKDLKNTETFNGITKALNYVPSFPEDLKAELKTPPPQGAPYAVKVVPTVKTVSCRV